MSNYCRRVIQYRYWIILATFVLLFLLGSGVRHLSFMGDYRAYFSDNNPQLLALEEIEKVYVKNDNILFVVSSKREDVFEAESLAALEFLTDRSWQLPYSQRVDSIINFQYTYAKDDELVVEALIPELPLTQELTEQRRRVALSEPKLASRIISPEANVSGVLVTFQMPDDSIVELEELISKVRALAKEVEDTFPSVKVRLSGMQMLNAAFVEAGDRDAVTLMPAMYLVIFLVVFLLLRSVIAVFAVIVIVTASVVSALGMAGWMDIELTATSVAAPTMIMTLAVADTIHIFVSMFGYMREGHNRSDALAYSIRVNFMPVLITSLTTAVGFLTLNLVDVPPFRDFGNISAMGILAALIYSFTFLPAFIACFNFSTARKVNLIPVGVMSALADFVITQRRKLLPILVILFALLLAAVPKNEVNNDVIKFFGKEIQFRQDSDYTMEKLTGLYTVEYSVQESKNHSIADPLFLKRLESFVRWLRQQPEVRHVSTITDTLKRLNKNLHADDPDWYRLPENRKLASQYLLLYELSLPFGLDLNNEINMDKSATRVIVTLEDITTNGIRNFRDASEKWLRDNEPSIFAYATGASIMFADLFAISTKTTLQATLVGMLLISVILILALRSFKHGVLSLIPNLLPAGLAFGVWALMVGQVNMAVSMVMTMTLGIVVDDTVHFMSKYLRGRREMGLLSTEAIKYAFNSVGYALFVTSIALVSGFFVMAQSSFGLNADSSQITLIAIFMALMVDFFLLPPLLLLIDKKKPASRVIG